MVLNFDSTKTKHRMKKYIFTGMIYYAIVGKNTNISEIYREMIGKLYSTKVEITLQLSLK